MIFDPDIEVTNVSLLFSVLILSSVIDTDDTACLSV